MKISTRGRYGLKAVVDLAVEYGNGPVNVGTLARMQDVSETYLEQLIGTLKRAELVKSVRGALGGYVLAKNPEQINVGEVLNALEGNTLLIECVGNETFDCDNACTCSARPLWLKLQLKINNVLKETTIKDLADDYIMQKRRRNDEESLS